MKHIKVYDTYKYQIKRIDECEKLIDYLTKFIHSLGYDYANYYDGGNYETEFDSGNGYIFYVRVRPIESCSEEEEKR